MASVPPTPKTLLGQLRLNPNDQEAWKQLVITYGQTLYRWARRHGLASDQAEDVTQEVLVRLVRFLRTHYDQERSFRRWLRACTRHAVYDYVQSAKTRPGAARDCAVTVEQLQALPDKESLEDALERELDRELFQVACQRVRLQLRKETSWDAFHLTLPVELGGQGKSAADAAADLGLSVQQVYDARHRIAELIQAEVKRLDNDA